MVAKGELARVHYIGTLEDGSEFDNSYKHGETLDFVIGAGHMIVGFEKAVAEMEVGEKRTVTLQPEEAYGERRADFVEVVPCELIPNWEELPVGEPILLTAQNGQQIEVMCAKVEDGLVYLDHNHFLAGKVLNFEIELVEVVPAGEFDNDHGCDDPDCGCGGHGHDHDHDHDCGCEGHDCDCH